MTRRGFKIENQKREHPYLILYIGNSLSTKFQLNLTILPIWTTFA